jgi:hypothetical protein
MESRGKVRLERRMEGWKAGRMEGWNGGRLEWRKAGRVINMVDA